jgi:hypothetical protein
VGEDRGKIEAVSAMGKTMAMDNLARSASINLARSASRLSSLVFLVVSS